ncbi:MAG: NUDIX hydrolase [Candidatus Nanoarchaeia archaeon]|nr:NUDIX hydrolase [Candidatus Nanoarchaeia archaeon]MDD5588077.1 NUDIX hydrolase [Candidatus Nanoarchaeia archaeon]
MKTKFNVLPSDKRIYSGHVLLVKRHFRDIDYDVVISRNSAFLLYIDENDEVYFAHQFRPAVQEKILALPAEMLDKPGLSPLEVILEGLIEEAGIKINKSQIKKVAEIYSAEGYSTEKAYLFIARGKGKHVGQHLEATEKIDVVKMSFDEAYKLVATNQIKCPKSAYLIMNEYIRRQKIINFKKFSNKK